MTMNCEFCNCQTLPKKVKKQHWLKGKLYIVENVDAEVCPECGERYFHMRLVETYPELAADLPSEVAAELL